jgi:cbb3-type cytochrome oxidase subunit 3
MRPDGILHGYFGEKFNFIEINEPFAAGIIYPAVMAAWTFLALSRTGFATLPAILVFASLFLLSLWFMYWLKNHEILKLETDLHLIETDSAENNSSNAETVG